MAVRSESSRATVRAPLPTLAPPHTRKQKLTSTPKPIRRLALNNKHQQHPHLLRGNRNRHRQHSPLPRPTRHPALLLLRCPHSHPFHHFLEHNLPCLPHRIHRLPHELRSRTRHLTQQHATSAIESAGRGGACKEDYVAVLGSARVAN